MTWDQFCANYKPGPYSRYITAGGLQRDDNDLRIILIAAHLRLDRFDALTQLPHRQPTEKTGVVALTSHRQHARQFSMETTQELRSA